jgi:hypothetical protein
LHASLNVWSRAEQIYEQAKALSSKLQQEALDFVCFLANRQQPIDPAAAEFTSELVAAFAEAKEDALKASTRGS